MTDLEDLPLAYPHLPVSRQFLHHLSFVTWSNLQHTHISYKQTKKLDLATFFLLFFCRDLAFIVAKLLFNSNWPSVGPLERNGWNVISRLLFKKDSWHFWWRFFFLMSIQYSIYSVRWCVIHSTKDMCITKYSFRFRDSFFSFLSFINIFNVYTYILLMISNSFTCFFY